MDIVDRSQINLLIIDDEDDFREPASSYFRKRGYNVETAEDGEIALQLLKERSFDIALVDIHMPKMTGVQLLDELKDSEADIQAIMLTGGGTISNAVESMKKGAFDFLTKPAKLNELDLLIQKAYRARDLVRENRRLRHALEQISPPSNMIGESEAMTEVFRLIDKISVSDMPALILGESGTGKELVARAIHEKSPLADKPLVVVNCAALPEALLESELFGHEKGAFTGAAASKPGLFEIADGGTLFIDECGELAGSLQAKLLRVLEDGSMRRVGSVKERHVKVRLIAATNRDLGKEVREGRFREDLYYRINVLSITIPPLCQRDGDISLLIRHFIGDDWHVSEEVLDLLTNYTWPGNVRQLQNALDRAKILAENDEITKENLPPEIVLGSQQAAESQIGRKIDLESLNRLHVEQVYRKHECNKSRTAKALGISRRSVYRLLEKYQIG